MATVAEKISILRSPAAEQTAAGVPVIWRAVTHRGLVRLHNEDNLCIETRPVANSQAYIFAIADGLGGHRGGGIASEIATDSIRKDFKKWNGKSPDSFAVKSIQQANQEIFSFAQEHQDFINMQTTTTSVIIKEDSLSVGHVGDCRLYRSRKGLVALLTKDHTVASDLLRFRLISTEQSAHHPGRHQLTRSVGSSPFIRVDSVKEHVEPGDTYLLCSDGLWSEVEKDDIKEALSYKDIEKSCEKLVDITLNGGAPDNLSAIVFRIP